MTTASNFAWNLRLVRNARGLTQAQLGSMLTPPMAYPTVAKIETGTRAVKIDEAVDIAWVLGFDLMAMVGAPMRPGLPA